MSIPYSYSEGFVPYRHDMETHCSFFGLCWKLRKFQKVEGRKDGRKGGREEERKEGMKERMNEGREN